MKYKFNHVNHKHLFHLKGKHKVTTETNFTKQDNIPPDHLYISLNQCNNLTDLKCMHMKEILEKNIGNNQHKMICTMEI